MEFFLSRLNNSEMKSNNRPFIVSIEGNIGNLNCVTF